jgi:tetratricopeptide (TPR) repeat protein
MQLRDFDAARVALERALTLNPKRPGAIHYYLGVAAEEQLQFAQARDFYRQADDAEYAIQTATRLAHIEARLGNKDGALAELAKLPGTSPQNQIAKLQLEAQIWRELKDLPRARSLLDEGLKQHADNADLLYDRSLVADQMGDTPGAERDLRQFLALNPESPLALNALGYTLANRTDRLEEAEDLIRRALAKEPIMAKPSGVPASTTPHGKSGPKAASWTHGMTCCWKPFTASPGNESQARPVTGRCAAGRLRDGASPAHRHATRALHGERSRRRARRGQRLPGRAVRLDAR